MLIAAIGAAVYLVHPDFIEHLQFKLTEGEYARARASGTKDLVAWEKIIEAAEILEHFQWLTVEQSTVIAPEVNAWAIPFSPR